MNQTRVTRLLLLHSHPLLLRSLLPQETRVREEIERKRQREEGEANLTKSQPIDVVAASHREQFPLILIWR
jgi:hypothetical protein